MLPDVTAFAADVLIARGALVEPDESGVVAVLPASVARTLNVPESCRLVTSAAPMDEPHSVPCGFGTPTLERLIEVGRGATPVATARLELEPPRPAHVRSLAERFAPRNGLSAVLDVSQGETTYLLAAFTWSVEADDRYEGLMQLVLARDDGAEPDAAFCEVIDPVSSTAIVAVRSTPDAGAAGAIAHHLPRRVAPLLQRAASTALESIRRRHARDHERITAYFASMIDEALSPRRRVDPATLRGKADQIVLERDAKLRDLPNRFTARISAAPAAMLWVTAPSVFATVELCRRKDRRELRLRIPAGAHALDRLTCDACGGTTSRPALCDDQLHLLCEACVVTAQGRPKCTACSACP